MSRCVSKPGAAELPRRLLVAAVRWSLAVACVMPMAALAVPVAAQEAGLTAGGAATVANTDGDGVVLREGPGYDARVLEGFPEGTAVSLTDGPISAEDGSVWYGVDVGGRAGYIVSDYLVPAGSAPAPAAAPAPTTAPVAAPPVGAVEAGRTDDAATSASPGTTTVEANGPTIGATEEGTSAPPPAAETEGSTEQAQAAPVAGTVAEATDLVNLRAGPGEGFEVLRVLPPGAEVTVTGAGEGGWTPVWYNGSEGYIVDGYLDAVGTEGAAAAELAQEAPAATAGATEAGPEAGAAAEGGRTGVATVTEAAELKAEPLATSATLATLPAGAVYEPTAGPVQGFYQVAHEGQEGWVSGAALAFEPTGPASTAAAPTVGIPAAAEATPTGDEATAVVPAFTGLVWPVEGGTWYIMQGYNGTSHVNRDSNWQYAYALDIARRDGETAGVPVLSPASGIVRWTDPGSGGLSIDLGGGHAVAMFHITLDSGVRDGQPIAQGERIGTISGPGGMGFAGSPHLHIALWETADGGNWDRRAAPFVGAYALEGTEFPDIGGSQQHRGLEFTP